jgi:hypothetical protein
MLPRWYDQIQFNLVLWSIGAHILYFVTAYVGLPDRVPFFVGLFAPVGIYSLLRAVADGIFGILTLVGLLSVLFAASYMFDRLFSRAIYRVVANLVLLFLVTLIVDLLLWHSWVSWTAFSRDHLLGCDNPYFVRFWVFSLACY